MGEKKRRGTGGRVAIVGGSQQPSYAWAVTMKSQDPAMKKRWAQGWWQTLARVVSTVRDLQSPSCWRAQPSSPPQSYTVMRDLPWFHFPWPNWTAPGDLAQQLQKGAAVRKRRRRRRRKWANGENPAKEQTSKYLGRRVSCLGDKHLGHKRWGSVEKLQLVKEDDFFLTQLERVFFSSNHFQRAVCQKFAQIARADPIIIQVHCLGGFWIVDILCTGEGFPNVSLCLDVFVFSLPLWTR